MFTFDERDAAIVAERVVKWNARAGPRVGDFVKLKDGSFRRFAHDWGEDIQPTHAQYGGTFYLGAGGCEHSGGLDQAIPKASLKATGEEKEGRIWIFHHDQWGGGRAVYTDIKCRVFQQQ